MSLIDRLLAKDKKGLYNQARGTIFYETGVTTLDYRNSTFKFVYDENNNVVEAQRMLGIQDGSINVFAGEPGTGKTTLVEEIAYNIVKPFEDGMVIHIDIEESSDMDRIKDITGMPACDIGRKYRLIQERLFIEEVIERIKDVRDIKLENRKEFEYDTGIKDSLGKPIILLEPTVIILDSLKMLNVGDTKKTDEMEGQTAGGRKAMAITQFMEKSTPMCKEANIILLIINHVKDDMSIGFNAQKSQLVGMKRNKKVLTGGKAARYLPSNVFYLDVAGKYNVEENGFDGTLVNLILWKTRSNFAGKISPLVFNYQTGFNHVMAMYQILIDNQMVTGRNPKKYISSVPEVVFDDRILLSELERPDVKDAILKAAKPIMESWTSSKTARELAKINDQDYEGE